MSELKSTDPNNEEVDLGQLFNAIGKLFDKFFAFFGKLFKGLLEIIIYILNKAKIYQNKCSKISHILYNHCFFFFRD